MTADTVFSCGVRPKHRRRRTLAALALAGVSSACSRPAAEPCPFGPASVYVHEGSELTPVEGARLRLSRGAPLACDADEVRALKAPLVAALATLPPLSIPKPLRLHLAPALPKGHAPLRIAEVHLSSKEVLLSAEANPSREHWAHELLHVVARRVPAGPEIGRRMWLTLEEALVQFIAEPQRRPREAIELPEPAFEALANPHFDPHVLAASLTEVLDQSAVSNATALNCLTTRQTAAPLVAEAAIGSTVRAFVDGCPPASRVELARALSLWLPRELDPF